ncbi:MAG: AraC family ligand binding domain-containing protein, partial [Clostridia bacterium]|nr:AraC family ligand binding domain-containing protein [Clostridia bacterium]
MKNHIIFTKHLNDENVLIERTSKHVKMPSMHSHDCYELYYMVNGERDYFVESNFFTVKTGQFALINKGQLHKTGGKGGERILISFTKD